MIKDATEITICSHDYKANELLKRKFMIENISTLRNSAKNIIASDTKKQRSFLCTNNPKNLAKFTLKLKDEMKSFTFQKVINLLIWHSWQIINIILNIAIKRRSNFIVKAKDKLREVRRD